MGAFQLLAAQLAAGMKNVFCACVTTLAQKPAFTPTSKQTMFYSSNAVQAGVGVDRGGDDPNNRFPRYKLQ